MKVTTLPNRFIRARSLQAFLLAGLGLCSVAALSATVEATYNSAADVPVTASSYTATGNTVNFSLNYAPSTGTALMVVKNTGLGFINGTFDNLTNGQPVALNYGGTTYKFVANYYAGNGNDLALAWANARCFAWGSNYFGQLGDGTKVVRTLPVPVYAGPGSALFGKTVVALAGSYAVSLALCSDGTVATWGYPGNLVPTALNTTEGVSALHGKTVVAISAGSNSSAALCSDGTVATWGNNLEGQLGNNTTTNSDVPVAVNTTEGVSALYGKKVVAISTGLACNLALCSDGTVAAWGSSNSGQLGDGSGTNCMVPVAVNTAEGSALFGKTVVAVSTGAGHSLALCSDGTVAAWGLNWNGELGDNTTTTRPVPVAVNTAEGVSALYGKTVAAIAAGTDESLVQCSDGTLAAWGSGYVGDNTWYDRHVPTAVNTEAGISALYGKTVVGIAAQGSSCTAICSDGTLTAWGANGSGSIGDGTFERRLAPVVVSTVSLASGERFIGVANGSTARHNLALVAGPPVTEITSTGAQQLADGSFRFAFTNTPGAAFSVLATTNLSLALSNWSSLNGVTEVAPGQYQFTDPQATNSPRRFYQVHSP